MDPSPFTLRELLWMSQARREHDWGQTSSIIAAIYEVNRDRKRRRRPFQPFEFNPLFQSQHKRTSVSVKQLTPIFGDCVKLKS